MHRDLKPENIIFTDSINGESEFFIKIIDFGLSSINKHKKIKGLIGTPYYVAPEILVG